MRCPATLRTTSPSSSSWGCSSRAEPLLTARNARWRWRGSVIDYPLIYSCLRVDDDDDDDDAVLATVTGRFGPRSSATIREPPHSTSRRYSRPRTVPTDEPLAWSPPRTAADSSRTFARVPDVGRRGRVGREAAENRARRWLRRRQSEFSPSRLPRSKTRRQQGWLIPRFETPRHPTADIYRRAPVRSNLFARSPWWKNGIARAFQQVTRGCFARIIEEHLINVFLS